MAIPLSSFNVIDKKFDQKVVTFTVDSYVISFCRNVKTTQYDIIRIDRSALKEDIQITLTIQFITITFC